jgi:nitrate reductase NapAB chaperone NapD
LVVRLRRTWASSARLDKLKHVPQCAARNLSAVSFQLSAFERHEIVAACEEYGGIVIQRAARKLSAVSFQLSAFERHEIVAACKEFGGIVIQRAARKLSAVSFQLLSGMKSSRRAENMEG